MTDRDDDRAADGPSDRTTMTEVLDRYADAGYTGSFETDASLGCVRCLHCGAVAGADRYELVSLRRLEGASDPDDMSAVVALACRACGARGSLVVMFGPQASQIEGEVLAAVQAQSDEPSEVPPHSAPGETVEDQS